MIVNVQKFCSKSYNISIDTLKGKRKVKDNNEYKTCNLSIILSWLLHPTQVYGSKSLIARFHGCKHKNRVYRLVKLYNNNPRFKSYVDKAKDNYYKS